MMTSSFCLPTKGLVDLADLDRITEILTKQKPQGMQSLKMPGFIAVSTDLLGSDHIGTVANDLLLGASSLVKKVADSIANVNSVGNSIANVNSVAAALLVISAVNNNKTNINTVATSISNVNIVGGDIANVNAVAGIDAEVTSGWQDCSRYAALYANWDRLPSRRMRPNKRHTCENSDTYFPTQKAVNDGLNLTMAK